MGSCHGWLPGCSDPAAAVTDADADAHVIVPTLIADCPQRESAVLAERCDIVFPGVAALFSR
jgi:hypothetical protein